MNQSVTQYFLEKGIIHDLMPAHCHEYNGIPERYNCTLMTMVRMMLLQQSEDIEKLDKRLWAEACHTAMYIKNRLPHSTLSGMTPFEAMFGRKPQLVHMRPFGATCYIHISEEKRPAGSKLDPRAERAMFLGYTDTHKIYGVLKG